MTSLKYQLIRFGSKNPEIKEHVDHVLNHLFVKSASLKKIARPIEQTISGKLMFAPTPLASKQINGALSSHSLSPSTSTVFVDEPYVIMSITVHPENGIVLSDAEVDGIAKDVLQNLKNAAYHDLEANGYWSDLGNHGVVVLKQRY